MFINFLTGIFITMEKNSFFEKLNDLGSPLIDLFGIGICSYWYLVSMYDLVGLVLGIKGWR